MQWHLNEWHISDQGSRVTRTSLMEQPIIPALITIDGLIADNAAKEYITDLYYSGITLVYIIMIEIFSLFMSMTFENLDVFKKMLFIGYFLIFVNIHGGVPKVEA